MENPQYYQIYEILFNKIKSGELQDGSLIEPELDLAERFEVSRVTVRKALELLVNQGLIRRQRGKGSYVTFKMGQDAIGETNLVFNSSHNRLIGFIVPEISSSYGMEILEGIEQQADELGFYLVMKLTKGEQKNEEKAIRDLLALGASGLIILPQHGEYYNPAIMELSLMKYPFVLIDLELKGLKCSYVGTDNRGASRKAMNYLIEKGHRNILYITPPFEFTSTLEDRIEGVKDAANENNILFPEENILSGFTSTMPGRNSIDNIQKDKRLLKAFLENHPEITAIFASEYNLILLSAEVLKEAGRSIPRDISLICFDCPSDYLRRHDFTYLSQDEFLVGCRAMTRLKAVIDGSREAERTILPIHLVEGSTVREL